MASLARVLDNESTGIPQPVKALLYLVELAYMRRQCNICLRTGVCAHREPDVELAEIESRPVSPGDPLPWQISGERIQPGRAEWI